jgi:hypothetical protein
MKGEIRAMDGTGDTKLIWDSDNETEVKAAKKMFDDLRAKKFTAFSVKKNGEKDRIITEFDPDAEKIILIPQLSGG